MSNTAVELKNGVQLQPEDLLLCRTEANQVTDPPFERPTEFLPDRWIGHESKEMLDRLLLTFGYGPRLCPGAQYASFHSHVVGAGSSQS